MANNDKAARKTRVNAAATATRKHFEEGAMRKVVLGALMVCLLVNVGLWADADEDKDRGELAKAVVEAKVSLEQGLSAAAHEGKPISAKFEIDEGKLQLSVYTAQGDKFSEVVVDHNTGKVAKTESITSGEDLSAAKAQSEAMSKAKQSLRATLTKVLKDNSGFRAVSIVPALKDGHPVAEVTPAMGDQWKAVSEKLD
jgi:hypothetical protein